MTDFPVGTLITPMKYFSSNFNTIFLYEEPNYHKYDGGRYFDPKGIWIIIQKSSSSFWIKIAQSPMAVGWTNLVYNFDQVI